MNKLYMLVLSKSEISTLRLMLRVLLGHWIENSTDSFVEQMRAGKSPLTRPLTKMILARSAHYRDLDYPLFSALSLPNSTVIMTASDQHFRQYRSMVNIIEEICGDSALPEAKTLQPLLLVQVPALKAAFEVAAENAEHTIEPEGFHWPHFAKAASC